MKDTKVKGGFRKWWEVEKGQNKEQEKDKRRAKKSMAEAMLIIR
jgi:hypothetical protein